MSNSPRLSEIYPCGRLTRRRFVHQLGGGFMGLALGGVWAEAGETPFAAGGLDHAAKAKSVIFFVHVRRGQSYRHVRSEG